MMNTATRRLLQGISKCPGSVRLSLLNPNLVNHSHVASMYSNVLDNRINCNQRLLSLSYSVTFELQQREIGKKSGKDQKIKGPKVMLLNKEMASVVPIDEFDAKLFAIYSKLKSDFTINLSLRTGIGIETLPIELEGQVFQLKEIAKISRKSSNVVVVNLSAMPDAVKTVQEAINNSGMNLAMQLESFVIILTLPKITREHRENMAKGARSLLTQAKLEIQETKNQYSRIAQDSVGPDVSTDLAFNVVENLKFRADKTLKDCEELLKAKTKELLD